MWEEETSGAFDENTLQRGEKIKLGSTCMHTNGVQNFVFDLGDKQLCYNTVFHLNQDSIIS